MATSKHDTQGIHGFVSPDNAGPNSYEAQETNSAYYFVICSLNADKLIQFPNSILYEVKASQHFGLQRIAKSSL